MALQRQISTNAFIVASIRNERGKAFLWTKRNVSCICRADINKPVLQRYTFHATLPK